MGDELPAAFNEETRRLRKMARNRRAAAASRQRKKAHVEALQAQIGALHAENEQLRRRLSDAGLISEKKDAHNHHSQQQPYCHQPEALWNHSLQLECTQLLPAAMIVLALLLCLNSQRCASCASSMPLRTCAEGR